MTKHDHGLKEKVEGAIDKVKGEVKEVVGMYGWASSKLLKFLPIKSF